MDPQGYELSLVRRGDEQEFCRLMRRYDKIRSLRTKVWLCGIIATILFAHPAMLGEQTEATVLGVRVGMGCFLATCLTSAFLVHKSQQASDRIIEIQHDVIVVVQRSAALPQITFDYYMGVVRAAIRRNDGTGADALKLFRILVERAEHGIPAPKEAALLNALGDYR